MADKASRQIAAVRQGDTTGRGAGSDAKKSQMPTAKYEEDGMVAEAPYDHPTTFSVHTKKKGVEVSIYGKAGKEDQAKKILDKLT
tara:strand:+ start:971 stop:1225 length:255 start_codon:yes stop_codon:yes gene_type:complete